MLPCGGGRMAHTHSAGLRLLRVPMGVAACRRGNSAMAGGCTIGANAVVQGAAGGIGREVVKKLFARGVRTVIGVDLRLADRATMSELESLWGLHEHHERRFIGLSEPGDTLDEREAFTVSSVSLQEAVADLGAEGVSACVCVGGGNPPGIHNTQDPAPATLPMDVYKAQFAFNFGASALTVSACIDALLAARGSVVLTSSVNGVLGIGEAGYSVSKAAMHPYVHNLASHYGPQGLNANAVALGTVGPTGPWVEALKADPDILNKIGSRNPRGVVGSASEAADVMVFLSSKESQLINGQVLVADGGWTLVAGTIDTSQPDKIWFE